MEDTVFTRCEEGHMYYLFDRLACKDWKAVIAFAYTVCIYKINVNEYCRKG